MHDTNLFQTLGQVSSTEAGEIFRDHFSPRNYRVGDAPCSLWYHDDRQSLYRLVHANGWHMFVYRMRGRKNKLAVTAYQKYL